FICVTTDIETFIFSIFIFEFQVARYRNTRPSVCGVETMPVRQHTTGNDSGFRRRSRAAGASVVDEGETQQTCCRLAQVENVWVQPTATIASRGEIRASSMAGEIPCASRISLRLR